MANPTMPAAPVSRLTLPIDRADRASPRLVPLRVRLGVLLGTVAALAVSIPTLLHALVLLNHLETGIAEDNLELARAVGALTEHRVDQTIRALELTAASPRFLDDVVARDPARMKERLARVVQVDRDLTSVTIVDREGVAWAHTLDESPLVGQDVLTRFGLDEAIRSGSPVVGQAFRGPVLGLTVVPISVPFRRPSGEVVGALRASLSLDRLAQHVNGVRPTARGRITIVDRDGRLLTSPDPDLILSDAASSDDGLRLALLGQTAIRRTVDAGEPVYAATMPIGYGWVVDVHFPVAEARAPVVGQLRQAALFAIGAFALALLVGLTVARRVTEPLLTLLKAMRSIRCEEGQPRLPRSSTTELAWLADELGAMRSALDARTAAMREALDTLARDVSARQAVEAELRASEARYRGVVESTREIVFQVDGEGRWIFLNPAWTELTEYSVDEALGRPFFDFVHPDDRPRLRELFSARVNQQVSPGPTEVRYQTRSGGTRWLEGYATVMLGPDGRPHGMSGTLSDVTERRHAEAVRARMLVREQEARAHQERAAEVTGIVQHMPCGVLVFDEDGCLTLANERALDMLSPRGSDSDLRLDHALVPHPSDILEDRLLGSCRPLVGLALGGSVVGDRELAIQTPGAGERVLVGSAAPLRSAHGEVRGAVVILTDVTRERRLMQDLVQSEGTLRQSLESLLVLHEAGRALSATLVEEEIGQRLVEGCMRIAHLDAALVFLDTGEADPRLLGADGDPLLVEHVLACDKERRSRRYVLQFSSTAGASPVPPCSELAIGMGHHVELEVRGRIVGVLEIYGTEQLTAATADALSSLAAHAVSAFENAHLYREVGDRERRLQEALRHLLIAQEEERGRVAYELHDGLAQVAAATHLSLQTFASQYRPRSEQRRQQLDRSVDLARRVVREARQVIGGLRPTVLDDFGLERALRLHVQELTGEGWTVEYDAQLGPGRLPGPTETVLYRIAQEALTNVRKHAQTLAATLSLRRDDGYVEMNVVDRGVGFSQAVRREDAGPGHQLGLVGMRERAALVGGWCVVQSQPGNGTRVTVRIPLQGESEAEPVSAAPAEAMRHAS